MSFRMIKHLPGYVIAFALMFLSAGTCKATGLSGTYTVGGTGADYATFTAAVSVLTTNGIKGKVVFNIAPGNYNETITIPAISGSSPTNTITFNGSGISGTRIYSALTSSGSAVIFLNQCEYVVIQNMTVENTSTATTGYAIYPA